MPTPSYPHPTLIAPSILAGNHANLLASLQQAEAVPEIEWIHLDIMDGHFVPNLTFGPQTVKDLRPHSKLFFDVHLMLDQPDRFIDAFIEAGANHITIHLEPDYPHAETLERLHQAGVGAGLCLNPDTPAERLLPFLEMVDLVLLMTVQPGFGGQSFRHDVLRKIQTVHRWRGERGADWRLEVDGGVDATTGPLCRRAGADTLVCGTAFYRAPNPSQFVRELLA